MNNTQLKKNFYKKFGKDSNFSDWLTDENADEIWSFIISAVEEAYKQGVEDNEIDFTKRLEVAIQEERKQRERKKNE